MGEVMQSKIDTTLVQLTNRELAIFPADSESYIREYASRQAACKAYTRILNHLERLDTSSHATYADMWMHGKKPFSRAGRPPGRKTDKSVFLRIPTDLLDIIDKRAAKTGLSRSAFIRGFLGVLLDSEK